VSDRAATAAGATAAIPDAFVDRSLARYQALAAPLRALLLALTGAGVALSVVYIFGLAPLLDVTYYFLLMAIFLPMAFVFLPAHKREQTVGWGSWVPAACRACCGARRRRSRARSPITSIRTMRCSASSPAWWARRSSAFSFSRRFWWPRARPISFSSLRWR
jgi:hypothetical protein